MYYSLPEIHKKYTTSNELLAFTSSTSPSSKFEPYEFSFSFPSSINNLTRTDWELHAIANYDFGNWEDDYKNYIEVIVYPEDEEPGQLLLQFDVAMQSMDENEFIKLKRIYNQTAFFDSDIILKIETSYKSGQDTATLAIYQGDLKIFQLTANEQG